MYTVIGLPTSLRIGPYDIAVELVDKFEPDSAWGQFDGGKATISLVVVQPSEMFALNVVLHEIMHVLYELFHLQPIDDEERIASTLAAGWVQVLRDNKQLVKWMNSIIGSV